MDTWIALLKGVNVGGKNKLPMSALATEMAAIGLSDVKTYIQSGNVIFRARNITKTTLEAKISSAIEAKFGFKIHVKVISCIDLVSAAAVNPFPEAINELNGKTLHLFFLAKTPETVDVARLEKVKYISEHWQIKGDVFYLHTPEGFGNSKLATQVEKILGVTATARNWNTVCALIEIAGASAK